MIAADDDAGARDEAEAGTPQGPTRGADYWRRLGFSSAREFNEPFERDQAQDRREMASQARGTGGSRRADAGRRDRGRAPPPQPVRQVGNKLRPDDHGVLAQAAKLYRCRPTTLARLLVNRGVRAVLDADRGRS